MQYRMRSRAKAIRRLSRRDPPCLCSRVPRRAAGQGRYINGRQTLRTPRMIEGIVPERDQGWEAAGRRAHTEIAQR